MHTITKFLDITLKEDNNSGISNGSKNTPTCSATPSTNFPNETDPLLKHNTNFLLQYNNAKLYSPSSRKNVGYKIKCLGKLSDFHSRLYENFNQTNYPYSCLFVRTLHQ